MSHFVKVMVSLSPHYHQLKSGEIKHQKSRPTNPIWRILVVDESKNLIHSRAYASQPSSEEITRIVTGILVAESLLSADVVIPNTVEKLCPGLRKSLMARGAVLYRPAHGFASGSRASKQAEEFFSYLEFSLRQVRETMASCEEIASVAGNQLGVTTTTLWLQDERDFRRLSTAEKMAKDIARLRGRDPEVGRKTREGEFPWAPLNKGKHVPPPEDVLSDLLNNIDHRSGLRLDWEMSYTCSRRLETRHQNKKFLSCRSLGPG